MRNKKCIFCGKLNYFVCVCRINLFELVKYVIYEDMVENDEYVYIIGGDK